MNKAIIRRLLNEYLDGEIGLADKAELERVMAQHPEVREEYKELRRLGLYMGSMPEISVHPAQFRERVSAALDEREQGFFTPQRAFSGAMVVALMVISLTFGMLLYQLQVFGNNSAYTQAVPEDMAAPAEAAYKVAVNIDRGAEEFFNRLLLEARFDNISYAAVQPFATQTLILEGAQCLPGRGLNSVEFAKNLPSHLRVQVSPKAAHEICSVAGWLAGDAAQVRVTGPAGKQYGLSDFMRNHDGQAAVYLELSFRATSHK